MVEYKTPLRVSIDFRENSNQGAVFDYIRQSIKLFIFQSLAIAKQRQSTRNKRRQAIKKQLQYIKRNLAHIEQLIDLGATLEGLNKKQYKTLLVLTEVVRQQQWLFDNDKQSIEDRIVSLSQPHIRPIVRGKAGKSVECGAKLSASCFEGYVFLDRMSWDNFNESGDLKGKDSGH